MEFYEIDFIEAGENKSGDAIALRYGNQTGNQINQLVHVVDGGYASSDDGQKLINHINTWYEGASRIDNVVLTHPDMDHASGLRKIIETCNIGTLWMNIPWLHVDSLLPLFEYTYTRDGLITRLKKDFPYIAELEEIAKNRGILVRDAFQGTVIGNFIVLAPTKQRYLELVLVSDKTPESSASSSVSKGLLGNLINAGHFLQALWGQENLKGHTEGTSCENEMSIVQYAEIAGHKILLTGDTGIVGLEEAHQYATSIGVPLPGIHRFQAPHHGGRRNLSTEVLDKWLGSKLPTQASQANFYCVVSANKNDEDHPRKSVTRALIHRGANVATTKGKGIFYWFQGKPIRTGWSTASNETYPEDIEED